LKLQSRTNEEPDISLTSLIDVVFLLLIFFMVSTTFDRQAALKVDLPEASTVVPATQEPDKLELVIDESGRMYLNDRALVNNDEETIRAAFIEASGRKNNLPLILRADRNTPHHFVVTVMDVAAQLGFSNLSIAAERTDGSEE
jgi:biopolymer transport protein ExbD